MRASNFSGYFLTIILLLLFDSISYSSNSSKIDTLLLRDRLGRDGVFIYTPNDTVSKDDGGVIIIRNGKRYKRVYSGAVDLGWFGAIGDYNGITGTDNTQAFIRCFSNYKNVKIPNGNYKTGIYPRADGINVQGDTDVTVSLFKHSTPVMVQFGSNSRHFGISFISYEKDLANQRAGIEQAENVIVENCSFKGFRNPSNGNAWGLYLKNALNVSILNCDFQDNTQSDIALVDNVKSVTIRGVKNVLKNGVHLNIEPNNGSGTLGAKILDSSFRLVTLLENWLTSYASGNIVFSNCKINELVYDGSGVVFENTEIDEVRPPSTERVYMGYLDLPINLSHNLIDQFYFDKEGDTNWVGNYAKDDVELFTDKDGTYRRINASGSNKRLTISYTIENIVGNNNYLVYVRGRAWIPPNAGWIGQNLHITWVDSRNRTILTNQLPFARGKMNENTPFLDNFAIVTAPNNAKNAIVEIGAKSRPTPIITDVSNFGVFQVLDLNDEKMLSEIILDRFNR